MTPGPSALTGYEPVEMSRGLPLLQARLRHLANIRDRLAIGSPVSARSRYVTATVTSGGAVDPVLGGWG
jgi:hypothetical protein